jgi:hypothetical protein
MECSQLQYIRLFSNIGIYRMLPPFIVSLDIEAGALSLPVRVLRMVKKNYAHSL